MTAEDIIQRLLRFRWRSHGYGDYQCSSCGAAMSRDEFTGNERREPCSPSCPWRQAEEYMAQVSV